MSITLVACMGATLPLSRGIASVVIVVAIAAVAARVRLATRPLGGWGAVLRPRAGIARIGVLAPTVFAAVVMLSVAARALAELIMAYPATIPALVVMAVAAIALIPGAMQRFLVLPAVVLAAVGGAAYEARGPMAHGWAQSGPLQGIHPFQATAVRIDGYGPFDLPINDYVEPAGGRGYDPHALADAIERALHRIAEVHFSAGPAQARKAFAEADAAAITTDAVYERLDRPPHEPRVPRIWVRSGTWGQGSRVEFMCPGTRDDPRGAAVDKVTRRMCPSKYANEASAGLAVTGRWPGYVEFRGAERLGLSRLAGATRTRDPVGERWILWERRVIAIAALIVVGLLGWRGRCLGRGGLAALATPLGVLLAGFALASLAATEPAAGRVYTPRWDEAWSLTAWLGALALPAAASLAMWRGPFAGRTGGASRWPLIAAAFAVVGVVARSDQPWLSWGGGDGIAAAVFAMADQASTSLGLDVQVVEAMVAATMAGLCACVIAHLLGAVADAGAATGWSERWRWPWMPATVVPLGTLGLAIALSLSRKTDAGLALIPAAMGAALTAGSALRRLCGRGAWPRPAGLGPWVVHLGWAALGGALALGASSGDPVRALYAGLGLIAIVLSAAVLVPDPDEKARHHDAAPPGAGAPL